MDSTLLEELTNAQLIQRYKELESQHLALKTEYAQFKEATTVKELNSGKSHADAIGDAEAKYRKLEQDHTKFKLLHAKNPEIFLTDYEHHNGLSVIRSSRRLSVVNC